MSTPIVYTFTASGQTVVLSAFRQIGAAADKLAAKSKAAAQQDVSQTHKAAAGKAAATKGGLSKLEALEAASLAKRAAARNRSFKSGTDAQMREMLRVARLRKRVAQEQINIDKKIARRRVATEKRAAREVAAARRKSASSGLGRVGGRIGRTLVSGAVIGTTVLAGAAMGAGIRQAVGLRDLSTKIAVMGHQPGVDRVDPDELRKSFRATALRNPGVRSQDVATGVEAIVERSGNLEFARQVQDPLAMIAQATGADFRELGLAAAAMQQHFDTNGMEEFTKALSILALQGKKGQFELSQAAAGAPKILGAARFAGIKKGTEGLALVGGLTQIASRQGGGGPAAVTAMENVLMQLIIKSKNIKEDVGIDTIKELREDPLNLIPKLITAYGGDQQRLIQRAFPKKAIRGIGPLVTQFNELVASGKTYEEAQAALVREIVGASSAAGAVGEMMEDSAIMQRTSSSRMAAAWESFTGKVDGELTDSIVGLIEQLPLLVEAAGTLVDAFALAAKGILGVARGWVMTFGSDEEKAALKKHEQGAITRRAERKAVSLKGDLAKAKTPEERARILSDIAMQEGVAEFSRGQEAKFGKLPEQLHRERQLEKAEGFTLGEGAAVTPGGDSLGGIIAELVGRGELMEVTKAGDATDAIANAVLQALQASQEGEGPGAKLKADVAEAGAAFKRTVESAKPPVVVNPDGP